MLIDLINKFSDQGIPFPMAKDTARKGPSSTLLFAYVSYFLAFSLVIGLFVFNPLQGTLSAVLLFALSIVFYLMRRISTFRVDLDKKEIDLEDKEDNNKPTTDNDPSA